MLTNERERVLASPEERAKLQEEVRENARELGLDNLVPLHSQDEFQMLKDMKDYGEKIREQIGESDNARRIAEERRLKEQAESRPAHLTEEAYWRMREERERREYEDRKIRL